MLASAVSPVISTSVESADSVAVTCAWADALALDDPSV